MSARGGRATQQWVSASYRRTLAARSTVISYGNAGPGLNPIAMNGAILSDVPFASNYQGLVCQNRLLAHTDRKELFAPLSSDMRRAVVENNSHIIPRARGRGDGVTAKGAAYRTLSRGRAARPMSRSRTGSRSPFLAASMMRLAMTS